MLNREIPFRPRLEGDFRIRFYNAVSGINEETSPLEIEKCKHEYLYMGYDVPEATLLKMQKVNTENFFEWDSLFQYKNIVNMTVQNGKLRTVCPYCHQS